MFLENDLTKVPNYVKARSLSGLRLACLKNNMRLGGFVNYFAIQQVTINGVPHWVAFFYETAENDLGLKDGKAE